MKTLTPTGTKNRSGHDPYVSTTSIGSSLRAVQSGSLINLMLTPGSLLYRLQAGYGQWESWVRDTRSPIKANDAFEYPFTQVNLAGYPLAISLYVSPSSGNSPNARW